jgi:hypothetical protein
MADTPDITAPRFDFNDPSTVERVERFAMTPECHRYIWTVGFEEATERARILRPGN